MRPFGPIPFSEREAGTRAVCLQAWGFFSVARSPENFSLPFADLLGQSGADSLCLRGLLGHPLAATARAVLLIATALVPCSCCHRPCGCGQSRLVRLGF